MVRHRSACCLNFYAASEPSHAELEEMENPAIILKLFFCCPSV